MKFTYIGCEGAPEVSTHYGVEFTIGVPAEVNDEFAIGKLSGHPHFEKAVDASSGDAKEIDENDGYFRDLYMQKFGKSPHHKMKISTIIEKLNADND